jgi:hypothetical protein
MDSSPATAARLVSRDYLVDQERLLRPALDDWATDLARELETARSALSPTGDKALLDASVCMNQASFVVASAGGLEAASRMCESQLKWVAHHSKTNDNPALLNLAVQPWVNIGRLRALRGDAHGAVPHFRLAEDYRARRKADLGPCSLPAEAWLAMLEAEPLLPGVLWNVYVIESMKAYLMASDPARVLGIGAHLREVCPERTHVFISEGEVLALLRSGQVEQAVARAADERPSSFYGESAFRVHGLTGLVMLSRRQQAMGMATGLLAILTQTRPRPADAPTLMRQLRQLGVLLEALQMPRYAMAAYLRGLDTCRDHDDQPLRFRFLASMLRLDPTHRSAGEWEREHAHLADRCLYAEVRRTLAAVTAPPKSPPLARLTAAVNAVLHTVG